MGKAIRGLPEASALKTDERSSDSIGAYIARQRKLRGISLEELEALTRIPRRSLERLESGVFDADPDGFVRGFVRTVSVAIGLDADDTVARMLAEVDPGRKRHRFGRLSVVTPLLLAVGVLGLGAGIVWTVMAGSGAPPAATTEDAAARRTRHDAVRELAVSRGIIPESAIPGAQPLDPVPPVPHD
jgi:cytoskeletal protein RodZ